MNNRYERAISQIQADIDDMERSRVYRIEEIKKLKTNLSNQESNLKEVENNISKQKMAISILEHRI